MSTRSNNLLLFIYNVIETILCCFRFRRWRYLQICFNFVKLLIRYDVPLPASAVKLCVKFLNHDALAIRKVSATLNSHILREMPACEIQLIYFCCGIWNLENSSRFLDNDSNDWNPRSEIHSVGARIQDCLGLSWIPSHDSTSKST